MTPEQPTDRAEINRANSQHSTGPKTVAGKLRSSQNALRHGLTSQVALLSTEDPQIYERHLKSFTDEYDPQGATEANLVQALADTAWRLNRIVAIESRLLTETGYNQQLAALEAQSKILANLSLHSQRLSRQFERTAAQLPNSSKPVAPRKSKTWNTSSTSWKCTNPKAKPTSHLTMASFFQNFKSTMPSAPAPATA